MSWKIVDAKNKNKRHQPVLRNTWRIILLPELSKKMAVEIPHAQFHCFENCGHIPHIEYPQEYVHVVKNFLV